MKSLFLVTNTLKRFPLSAIFGLAVTVIGICLLNVNYSEYDRFQAIFLCLPIGYSLTLGVDLLSESKKFKPYSRYLLNFFVIGVLFVFYFFVFRKTQMIESVFLTHVFAAYILSVLFLIFVPFIFSDREKSFFNYFNHLFLRFIQTVLYFGVLFLGIVGIFFLLNYLFDFYFGENFYITIWLIIVGIPASLFFLSGVPKLTRLERLMFNTGVLNEYVVMPLTVIYFVILYIYILRILFLWKQTENGFAWLIIGFSVLGIAAYFFSSFSKKAQPKIVGVFRKFLFPGMFPLVVALFFSIGYRINEYGFTVPRYFVLAFGIWLFLMCFYFILSKRRTLKFIPVFLFIIFVFAIYAPGLNVFRVSEQSQIGILKELLIENDILKDGKILPVDREDLLYDDYLQITSVLQYLIFDHHVNVLQVLSPDQYEDLSEADDDLRWKIYDITYSEFFLGNLCKTAR